MTQARRGSARHRPPAVDPVRQHRDWLALVEVTGPFLSLPVLRETWPTLEPIDAAERDALRRAHGDWRTTGAAGQRGWVEFVLADLLGWGDDLRWADAADLTALAVDRPEHDTTISPDFVLTDPPARTGEVKPADVRVLGLLCDPGQQPTTRIAGSAWAATPVDRVAQLCRHHDVPLGLVTDGRWWALVRAPRGDVTSVAVFDAVAWPDTADRDVVRAFRSLLERRRFFAVPDAERLPALWKRSEDSQEDLTEALGVQVRQAVELLVAAIGRADQTAQGESLRDVTAHEVYRGAVSVMMRVVFLLFAEERRLLPSDNELYAQSYSAGRLGAELEQRAREGSENELENSTAAWHRLLALFTAVHDGIDHPRLTIHAHDGSLFDPDAYLWMPRTIDDRTVLHMLRAVQHVWVGTGKNRERRTLSFRQLDVEQIGYVYEGLLSFEGYRAAEVVVGLVGKPGLEEEVPLSELEDLPTDALAATLAERYKASGIGSIRALEKRLAPLDAAEREAARSVLGAVVGQKISLIERLLPFYGLLRPDLRELPVVIMPGALYVTTSALRRNTGTHYTPRRLAEEVVEHALQPLLYHHGPLQTADESQWTHKSSDELLQLKVADIAMGSAAFLVAAARYLGEALVTAWAREGRIERTLRDDTLPRDADEDPMVVEARRQVIEHCLYGVDINPMAVEMAKLSLWLVSMDPQRPFTFLDDRLVAGDSLLGVTSLEQIEYLCLDPNQAREWREGTLPWSADVRSAVAEATAARRRLTDVELGDDPIAALEHKRLLLGEAEAATGRLRLFADLAVGAALAGSKKMAGSRDPRVREEQGEERRVSREGLYLEAVDLAGKVAAGEEFAAREKARRWLETDTPADAKAAGILRTPLHWPLVFPEVFDSGGFDAVIGNPPFLGGLKLQTALGGSYRDYLVGYLGRDVRGNRGTGDLVAYFALRVHQLLTPSGQAGLLATNTLAQGDSRRVGLDQILADGARIRRAIKSAPWPSRSASLEYCAVWFSEQAPSQGMMALLDGVETTEISASLEPASRASGNPYRLMANANMAFQGANILGLGFTLSEQVAREWIAEDPRYRDVLFPYLSGDDVNSSPDASASRWVINFHDWSEDRARTYPHCYEQVRALVKPERDIVTYSKAASQRWWQFLLNRPALRKASAGLGSMIALTQVSNTVIPLMIDKDNVCSHKVVVFASDDRALLVFLSSSIHYWWTVRWTSTMGAGSAISYSPVDVFQTLARPDHVNPLRHLGDRLDTYRRSVMLARQTGLTKTYNLVFDPTVHDEDIVELRRIHKAIDEATVRAYGWDDLLDKLDHGFHPAGRDLRYTIGPWAQREILDRLLELNHERYAEEVAKGLHDKKKPRAAASKTAAKKKPADPEGLF